MSQVFTSYIVQVHMVQRGVIDPLIKLVQSQNVELQEVSAYALGLLAEVINRNHFFSCPSCLVVCIIWGEEQSFITCWLSLMLVCLCFLTKE